MYERFLASAREISVLRRRCASRSPSRAAGGRTRPPGGCGRRRLTRLCRRSPLAMCHRAPSESARSRRLATTGPRSPRVRRPDRADWIPRLTTAFVVQVQLVVVARAQNAQRQQGWDFVTEPGGVQGPRQGLWLPAKEREHAERLPVEARVVDERVHVGSGDRPAWVRWSAGPTYGLACAVGRVRGWCWSRSRWPITRARLAASRSPSAAATMEPCMRMCQERTKGSGSRRPAS